MTIDSSKIKQMLTGYQQMKQYQDDDLLPFLIAICYLQLGNFLEAKRLFTTSSTAMFLPRAFWRITGDPNLLVDVCILAGCTNRYTDIIRELEYYRLNPPGSKYAATSYVALYAYTMMELLMPSSADVSGFIQGLLDRPKIKDGYAMGQVLQAIIQNNQVAFNDGLGNLLKVHEGMAKRGGLRETSEGLLCMPAMSLSYIALQRNMKVELKNDYLNIGYLQFISGYSVA